VRQDATGAERSSADAIMNVLDALDEGVVGVDLLGRVSAINREAARLTGVEREGAIGSAVGDTVRLFDESTGEPLVLEGASPTAERRAIVVDARGGRTPVAQRCIALRGPDDEVQGMVLRLRRLGDEVVQGPDAHAALARSGILGILTTDLTGRVLEVNDAALAMAGYPRDEVMAPGFRWSELTPSEWRAQDEVRIAELRRSGASPVREKEYVRKDGKRVSVLVGSAAVHDARGAKTDTYLSFVLDVTAQRRAESALARLQKAEASEERFRGLLEAAPDAIVIVDPSGRIVLVNASTEAIFRRPRSELLGASVESLVPQRFRERHTAQHQAFFAQALRKPTPALELCGLRADECEFPLEMTLSPLTTEEGPLVILAMRDISDRRHAEAQRARLAAIVDSSDDAIVGKTLEGIVTSWNAGAARIFGYAPEEIVGRSIKVIIPPGREQEEASILERLGRGERIAHFRTVRLRKDGREIHVAITSSAVRDARGVLVGASKVARDITDQVRAEEELARAKDAAEAANRELEAFSYSVAHDLRAPLRGMGGFARVLLEGYRDKLDAEGQDWLQEIVLNAQKMAALIDALLSLARLTRSEPRYTRVDLSALAREAADQLVAADACRDVEWSIEPGMVATLDPSLARALVGNLLGNAWKFTSKVPASRRACIEVGTTEIEGRRVFFVRDNGAGFDMAFADKLFGPFQRLHTVDEFPGTGIGLATVQRIVRRHGGRVWAEGRVDGGATFYFAFNEVVSGSPQ